MIDFFFSFFLSSFLGIVREMANKSDSMLKSISTSRLTPQHHLWYAPLILWTPALSREAAGCSEKMADSFDFICPGPE